VRTVEQANQAFDDITYEKGESVISMLEGFAGADTWRDGIRAYMKKFAHRNTRTDDLWTAIEGAGAKGLTVVARDFTTQPGIPLIQVGPARCVNGKTVATIMQGQFSNDRKAQAAATPTAWHVPVRASIGGKAPVTMITQSRSGQIEVPGCGVLLLNPGQTGYYRTLYSAPQADALRAAFPRLGPVDQYGTLTDAMALSEAGYQPMARGLDLLAAIPANGHGKLVSHGIGAWAQLYGQFDGDAATQAVIKAQILHRFGPRLDQLGFAPRAGEPPLDSLLRQTLITQLGRIGDPRVVNEGQRLFAAWQRNRNAIPGALQETWLGVIAQNATPATWDALHKVASQTRGSVERTALYQLLGRAQDEALARRALDLALTKEPGATVSAGIIRAAADRHPAMALDFFLSHLAQVNGLVDISGRSRFLARLVGDANDPAFVAKLNGYANANLAADDRRPVAQAVAKIQWRGANLPRIRAEATQWLKAHPAA
ncbi:MAG: ERAP1-like C-terminal domain-containing protein, partial [Sphingomonas sp.]|uniref:M1 family metallopeptidase n=1 Tax=Sphingomonas sp. TaxID=28214 RepID=UPI001804B1B1